MKKKYTDLYFRRIFGWNLSYVSRFWLICVITCHTLDLHGTTSSCLFHLTLTFMWRRGSWTLCTWKWGRVTQFETIFKVSKVFTHDFKARSDQVSIVKCVSRFLLFLHCMCVMCMYFFLHIFLTNNKKYFLKRSLEHACFTSFHYSIQLLSCTHIGLKTRIHVMCVCLCR